MSQSSVADFGQINSVSIEHSICRRSSTLVTKASAMKLISPKTSRRSCVRARSATARGFANEWREGYSKCLPPVLDDGDTRAASNSCWREIRLA